MPDLNKHRVLIVGAAGGIGKATAKAFSALGADITAAGLPGEGLDAVAREVLGEAAPLDLLNNEAIESFFDVRQPFDHVVIAAASTKTGTVAELAMQDAMAAMNSKFWGAYRIARAAKIVDTGSLTLISGIFAQRPYPSAPLQGAINAALEGLVRGLALERAPVRYNAVSPGLIDTPVYAQMPEADREAMFDQVVRTLPVKRIGQPDNIAQAIVFAATNPFVTGSVIAVDGGGLLV